MSQHLRSSNVQTAAKTDYAGTEELWAVEQFLTGYNTDVVSHLSQPMRNRSPVLEFGAGIGTLALLWEKMTGTKPECLEVDSNLRTVLVERGFRTYDSLNSIDKSYDAIYTSNVLEHIEDDVLALTELRRHMNNGGLLGIYVPALMVLYSGLDRSVGHYRRYGKLELMNKVRRAGFEVTACRYVDCLGFFASLAVKVIGYKAGGNLGSSDSLWVYDKLVYPLSRRLDRIGLSRVFGKNLLLIAERRD